MNDTKTPILLVETINWTSVAKWQANQLSSLQSFSLWQKDWESLNHNKFMTHYSADYFSNGRDYKSNNYNFISDKELYWKKDSDAYWRIIFES
ncbi:MAG: hypothetical protein ISR69_07760 [Gammaproteobacteria bacterium]|nr:hypothetical protein [Gammaproteobacteria bacterium]